MTSRWAEAVNASEARARGTETQTGERWGTPGAPSEGTTQKAECPRSRHEWRAGGRRPGAPQGRGAGVSEGGREGPQEGSGGGQRGAEAAPAEEGRRGDGACRARGRGPGPRAGGPRRLRVAWVPRRGREELGADRGRGRGTEGGTATYLLVGYPLRLLQAKRAAEGAVLGHHAQAAGGAHQLLGVAARGHLGGHDAASALARRPHTDPRPAKSPAPPKAPPHP